MWKINSGTGANFPDSYFCTYVSDNFDTDGDGYFTQEELDNVYTIDVSSIDNTLNLEGIKFFGNVKTLKAVGRDLSGTFDFTGLQKLETVDFSQSRIASYVNLQGIATLQQVNIKGCSKMKGLYVSNCPALFEINAQSCDSLQSIDVTESNPFLNINCTEDDPIYKGLPDTVTGLQSTMTFNGLAYPYP